MKTDSNNKRFFPEKVKADYKDAIMGRMANEGAKDFSDTEIERTLSRCVAGGKLIELAKVLREEGALSQSLLNKYKHEIEMSERPREVQTRISF